VRIPGALRRVAIADVDNWHVRLGQSPGEQAALAELRFSVALSLISGGEPAAGDLGNIAALDPSVSELPTLLCQNGPSAVFSLVGARRMI